MHLRWGPHYVLYPPFSPCSCLLALSLALFSPTCCRTSLGTHRETDRSARSAGPVAASAASQSESVSQPARVSQLVEGLLSPSKSGYNWFTLWLTKFVPISVMLLGFGIVPAYLQPALARFTFFFTRRLPIFRFYLPLALSLFLSLFVCLSPSSHVDSVECCSLRKGEEKFK